MGNHQIRHLVKKTSGYYFQPSKSMRAHGFHSQPLGKEVSVAVSYVEAQNEAYDAIRQGAVQTSDPLPSQGSVARYIQDLKRSTAYIDKSLGRQAELDRTLGVIDKVFGERRLGAVTAEQVEAFYVKLRETRSDSFAARVMKDMRFMYKRAVSQRTVIYDPTRSFQVKQPAPRKQRWSHKEIERAIKVGFDSGFAGAAVALAIAYDTGMSSADIRALTVGQMRDGTWHGTRVKTGENFSTEFEAYTLVLIARYHEQLGVIPMPDALVVRTRRGCPYTKDRLSRDVRIILSKAGISDDIQMRDLRRTRASEAVESGVTDAELAAMFGVSPSTVTNWRKTYAPSSDKMVINARGKLKQHVKGLKV